RALRTKGVHTAARTHRGPTTAMSAAIGNMVPFDLFGCPLEGRSLIEASAGTGKTWNICGLYLRLLLDRGLGVQQILVMTFTNAATAELRERIRSRIVDVLNALREDADTVVSDVFCRDLLASLATDSDARARAQRHLDAALQQFDEAAIFTIH